MCGWLHFGTASKVRAASLEDLEHAPGESAAVAQTVYEFYHPGGGGTSTHGSAPPMA